MKFEERLKLERIKHNLTQEEMSKRLNVTLRRYTSWENGKSCPTLSQLVNICNMLQVKANYLLGVDDEDN